MNNNILPPDLATIIEDILRDDAIKREQSKAKDRTHCAAEEKIRVGMRVLPAPLAEQIRARWNKQLVASELKRDKIIEDFATATAKYR